MKQLDNCTLYSLLKLWIHSIFPVQYGSLSAAQCKFYKTLQMKVIQVGVVQVEAHMPHTACGLLPGHHSPAITRSIMRGLQAPLFFCQLLVPIPISMGQGRAEQQEGTRLRVQQGNCMLTKEGSQAAKAVCYRWAARATCG